VRIRKTSRRTHRESRLYPIVERWLKRHFSCFKTTINKGLRYGRIDVVGVRDVGGDLSGDVETVAIEVKLTGCPFATATGQTLGYKVYTNRIYLAELRKMPFTHDEIHIASHLGVGLIWIRGSKCIEVLSSPVYTPIPKLNLRLLENLCLGKCQWCGSFFEIGDEKNHWAGLARENVEKAVRNETGLMYWNRELGDRKHKLHIRSSANGDVYERRFLCADCVYSVLGPLQAESNGFQN
jgi:hypothetical protein